MNEEDRVQREEYPSIAGQARIRAYPLLEHSGRRYSWRWEQKHWSWQRVCEHVAEYAVPRRVDSSGKIGLYHHKLYIGTMHKGLTVYVQLDPLRLEWIVSAGSGTQLHRSPAHMLTPTRVQRLQVAI